MKPKSIPKEFKDALGRAAIEAFDSGWKSIKEEVSESVSLSLQGGKHAILTLLDADGETWFEKRLSTSVSELLESIKDSDAEDIPEWMNALAADFEKQASRLRKRAMNDDNRPITDEDQGDFK